MKSADLPFIGRERELALLEKRWRSPESDLVVLYGRRRVGKTELLLRFAEGKRGLFAVGTRSDAGSQVRHFMEELSRVSGDPGLAGLSVRDWDTALGRLDAFLARTRKKIYLVLDEFQWMVEAAPSLPSILQKRWDAQWSRNGRVFLVLCGSYMGFMEREVLAHRSPLFGRRTSVLHLMPLPFEESRRFHGGLPIKEQAKRHLLCGGIPAYHRFFRKRESLSGQILDAFLLSDAPLAKEADFLLMEELKDPKLYFSLLEGLGPARRGVSELASSLGIERSRIPYYTKNLIDLRYIERRTPLLSYRDTIMRKTLYSISDPLLRFWFTFIYPNAGVIERIDPRTSYSTLIAPRLDAYWGLAFENLAADLFLNRRVLPRCAEPFKLGSYWDKSLQIDFVVALKSGLSYLGESKWGRVDERTALDHCRRLDRLGGEKSFRPVLVSAEKLPPSVKSSDKWEAWSLEELVGR